MLEKIKSLADSYMLTPIAQQVDLKEEAKYLEGLSINRDNVYLHYRGHNIYNLILHIGNYLVPNTISFENNILNCHIPKGGYWEYDNVINDIDDATR